MMLSSTSRPTLIFPVEDPRVDPHVKNALIPAQGPQNFLKAPLRGGMRCAHGAARTERPPVSTDWLEPPNPPIFWISFSDPSKSQRRLAMACVACLSGH